MHYERASGSQESFASLYYCFLSALHGRLPQEAMSIDPDADLGEKDVAGTPNTRR
jgi:hypothetical protein